MGDICGGTAACAWTITQALPQASHTVLFLSPLTSATRQAFQHCHVEEVQHVDDETCCRRHVDLVLFHNTSRDRAGPIRSALSILYQHSFSARACRVPAEITVACSAWLANQFTDRPPVLYQPVPRAPGELSPDRRHLDDELIIGRICTPHARKWPPECPDFYAHLATRFPEVSWEFVGCPPPLQERLQSACRGRARFWNAVWGARRHLWRWHALLYHHPGLTESFGRVAAEAMRAGCVPIVDHRGGFAEQIRHGDTGFLCRNATGFAEAIAAIIRPALRWRISRQARVLAEQRFSPRAFRNSLTELLSH